jgi:uncharacterized membrane protein YkvI
LTALLSALTGLLAGLLVLLIGLLLAAAALLATLAALLILLIVLVLILRHFKLHDIDEGTRDNSSNGRNVPWKLESQGFMSFDIYSLVEPPTHPKLMFDLLGNSIEVLFWARWRTNVCG